MISPYKKELEPYNGGFTEITLHRNGAADITGTVNEISDFGVSLLSRGEDGDGTLTFVAFEDIRGVARSVHAPVD